MSMRQPEGPRVPVWLDILLALWAVVAFGAFLVKIFLDAGMASGGLTWLAIAGRYAYALMIVGCGVGVGLALVRRMTRDR